MSLYYQTDYRLGRRAGRVCRTYTGVEAAIAIGVDLLLSVVFAVVGFALRLAWQLGGAVMTFAVELVQVPFRTLRWTVGRYRPASKPVWAGHAEI